MLVSNSMKPYVSVDALDTVYTFNGVFYNNLQRIEPNQTLLYNQVQKCLNETTCFSLDLDESQSFNNNKTNNNC